MTINEQFKDFIALFPGAPDQMVDLLKKAFYGGYMSCFANVNDIANFPEDVACAKMSEVYQELTYYTTRLQEKLDTDA